MRSFILKSLNRCNSLNSLKSIHTQLLISGSVNSSDLVLNKLLRLYFRFGQLYHARKLFDEIPQPNAFHWTALIHGYVENQKYGEAFSLFSRMLVRPEPPLSFTVASVCKGLAREKRVKDGESLYGFVLKCGFGCNLAVQNALLDLFMRCGRVDSAAWIFDEMVERDTISWNTMVSGYGHNGRVEAARELFDKIPEKDSISWKSMINVYAKAGAMEQARILFDKTPTKDLASWNLMLFEFMKLGDIESAVELFSEMREKNVESWTIMIDGYSKAGDANTARCLFDQMPEKNLASCSSMIGCYARNGEHSKALELCKHFKKQGIKADDTFIPGIISACSQLGVLEIAESMVCGEFNSLFSDLRFVASLIDMYGKCGSIERAQQVFEMIPEKDLLCYSNMIQAFANHGLSHKAIDLFHEMVSVNIKPDEVAFLGLLSACNHGGLVNEGRRYFKEIIHPSEKHYSCIINLLGRAGFIDEAYSIIRTMPMKPNAAVWGPLLAASRVHCYTDVGEVAAAELFKIEPNNSGNYILLSHLYASVGRWDDVAKVRVNLKQLNIRRNRASSWIELGSLVHEFILGDLSHFDSEIIYFVLQLLNEDMKLLGFVGDSRKSAVSSICPGGCY